MRNMQGQDAPEAPPPANVLKPLVDKVGVPLLWFGIGYLAATLMQRPQRKVAP